MNGALWAFAALGALVTFVSVAVAILLYARGAYSKQKMQELRDDAIDASRRAEGWAAEAQQKDQALQRCAREAKLMRKELDAYEHAPTLAVQEIKALIAQQTAAILEAVREGRSSV